MQAWQTARIPGAEIVARRVLVTGGTSGLGLAMASALVDAGASVVLTGRDGGPGADVAAGLTGPGRAHGLGVDTRDEAAVAAGIDRAAALLGGLDVVVLNAGLGMRTVNPRFLSEPQPFWEVDPDGFPGRRRHQPHGLLPRRPRRGTPRCSTAGGAGS